MSAKSAPPFVKYYRDWLGQSEAEVDNDRWGRLRELCDCHPVLRLALNEEDLKTNAPLREYLHERVLSGSENFTLTDFCVGYLDYRLPESYRFLTSRTTQLVIALGKEQILDRLGQLALQEELLRRRSITRKALLKVFPVQDSDDMDAYVMGLLTKDVDTKVETFSFSERFVQRFLIARHQFRVLLGKKLGQKKVKLTKDLRQSAKLLPQTSDIWALTFGLMADDGDLKEHQAKIFDTILRYSHEHIAQDFRLMFSLQVAFESANRGSVGAYVEQMTRNQLVDMSNLNLVPYRLPYMISVLGHMIPAASNLFGLKLSKFGLSVENINLLVTPSNDISEHSIQFLDLSNNVIGPRGMKLLQRFLVKANSLASLNLSGCGIGDEGALTLSELLMCSPLHVLILRDNGITTHAGKPLLYHLQYCSTLHTLDLAQNQLDDHWILLFVQHLAMYRGLRSVDLHENCLSAMGQQLIRDTLRSRNPGNNVHDQDLIIYHFNQKPMESPAESAFVISAVNLKTSPIHDEQGEPTLIRQENTTKTQLQESASENQSQKYALKSTTRKTLEDARARFFSDTAIGYNQVDRHHQHISVTRRSNIGGGAVERLKTIEKSMARRSLSPGKTMEAYHFEYSTDMYGTDIQETPL